MEYYLQQHGGSCRISGVSELLDLEVEVELRVGLSVGGRGFIKYFATKKSHFKGSQQKTFFVSGRVKPPEPLRKKHLFIFDAKTGEQNIYQ